MVLTAVQHLSPIPFNTDRIDCIVNGAAVPVIPIHLVKATDAPAAAASNGVISAISQKSDFLRVPLVLNTILLPTQTVSVVIVNPAPATGPIYYIPNNFAY